MLPDFVLLKTRKRYRPNYTTIWTGSKPWRLWRRRRWSFAHRPWRPSGESSPAKKQGSSMPAVLV